MVFGKVEGADSMAVVRAIEEVGCGSGETSADVVITDCGERGASAATGDAGEAGDKKKD